MLASARGPFRFSSHLFPTLCPSANLGQFPRVSSPHLWAPPPSAADPYLLSLGPTVGTALAVWLPPSRGPERSVRSFRPGETELLSNILGWGLIFIHIGLETLTATCIFPVSPLLWRGLFGQVLASRCLSTELWGRLVSGTELGLVAQQGGEVWVVIYIPCIPSPDVPLRWSHLCSSPEPKCMFLRARDLFASLFLHSFPEFSWASG